MDNGFLQELNTIQRQAVTTINGPVMVIAGPGSGKTRVLTYRIAHMIHSGIPPHNILSLTFTNKAAKEMRERIGSVVGNKARNLWAGTFHSIFARILRREADKIGYPQSFIIYDTTDVKTLLKSIISNMSLDPKTYTPNAILNRISGAKSNLTTPKLYEKNENLLAQDQMNQRPWTHKIYTKYAETMKLNGAMDFDDLLLLMFRLLHENKDEVTEKYRSLFQYILVDEFQDTNYLQYAILKKLTKFQKSPENICIVGDDAQSIYAFRGATIDNILDFEKDYAHCKQFKLEQNYRSTDHIVEAANEIIKQNKKQIQKKIWTEKVNGNKIKVFRSGTDVEEGRKIVNTIVEYKNRYHISDSDIAILYRTNAQSRIFEEQLRKQNISYKIIGGLSFYQRKEVKDLISYLRLVVNHADDEAFKRIINVPKRGIGKTSQEKILEFAQSQGTSILETIPRFALPGKSGKSLQNFYRLIKQAALYAQDHNAYETIEYIYKESRMYEMLKSDTSIEGMGRIENIVSLIDGAKEFVENDEVIIDDDTGDRSLASYLQNIALISDLDSVEESEDYVTLMSVHAAKGLEFNTVFIVGIEENIFPSIQSMDSSEAIAEERRLFYVAVTRAEKNLILSYATSRYQYGNMRYNDVSRFLYEIDESHFDESYTLRKDEQEPYRSESSGGARISGIFKPRRTQNPISVDLSNFVPSPSQLITEGQRVLHQKFGYGEVIEIDGLNDKKVATIYFENGVPKEKRIMLKFAKLQIIKR